MTKAPIAQRPSPRAIRYTELPTTDRTRALDACREAV
jgi:hypothetical protein